MNIKYNDKCSIGLQNMAFVATSVVISKVTPYLTLRISVPEENTRNDCEILKLNGFSQVFSVRKWKSAYEFK